MSQKGSTSTTAKSAPGPSGTLSSGDVSDPLRFLLQLSREYGDVARYHTAYGEVYLINHPDLIGRALQNRNMVRGSLMKQTLGEGILTSEGTYWRSQRHAMQPAFHQESIAAFDSVITASTISMLEQWQEIATLGKTISLAQDMTCLTLRIISKALYDTDANDDIEQLCDAITELTDDMGYIARTLFRAQHRVDPPRNGRVKEALKRVDEFAYSLIRNHREKRGMRPDLLSMLLEHATNIPGGLSDRQIRDEVVTTFLAGHITTANMLVWTWYLLSDNPAIERRMHSELAQVLGGRTPTVQDVSQLPYTRRIIQESLRLYPPVWFIARRMVVDGEIDGFRIPANAAIVISPYTMHRHPKFWENPERVDPDRFAPDWSEKRHRYAYLPFGGGQHLCIGTHLAMLEGQLVLATVAQRYRICFSPGQSVEPEPILTLKPPHDLRATLEPQDD
jgi:cytochrome P450